MKFPIPTTELSAWLPHRAPMIWIDEVSKAEPDQGEARVIISPEAPYMTGGRLRPSAVIEFIAQAYGYVAACQNLQNPTGSRGVIQKAFLVGVRSADFDKIAAKPSWHEGECLLIRVSNFKQVGPMQILDGEVYLEATGAEPEQLLATANLKLYSESAPA